jgi:PhnB protein
MMSHGESPMADQVQPEWRNKIMHAQLTVNDMVLMGTDAPPEYFEKPQGFSVSLQFDDMVEGEQIFHALAENGTVRMPLQQTFWAKRFGMLIDRFGIPWMINCN